METIRQMAQDYLDGKVGIAMASLAISMEMMSISKKLPGGIFTVR